MLEQAIYNLLRNTPAITDIVSDRVHLGILPKQPVYPCVRLYVSGSSAVQSADGTNALNSKRISFDCYCPYLQYVKAHALSDTLLLLLQDLRGTLSDGTQICGTLTVNDGLDLPVEVGTGGYVHRTMVEVKFWYLGG